VAVEVLAGSVVAHGGARLGVPGGGLDVAQVDAGPQHLRAGSMALYGTHRSPPAQALTSVSSKHHLQNAGENGTAFAHVSAGRERLP
jgi:hypothetical protein